MTDEGYKKPPIVEATLEVRFVTPVSDDQLRKVRLRLADDYKKVDELTKVMMSFTTGKAPPPVPPPGSGGKLIRLTSEDASAVVQLHDRALIVSKLAPYEGWADFRGRAHAACQAWTKVIGKKPVARLGLRYINRIDIPGDPTGQISPLDWVRAKFDAPLSLNIRTNEMQGRIGGMLDDLHGVKIATAIAPSPLINHLAYILDIDIFRAIDLPADDHDMWKIFDGMRDLKNTVFEACITDKSRALFA